MKHSMRWLLGLAVCVCLVYVGQAWAGSVTLFDNTDTAHGDMTVNGMFPSQTGVNNSCNGQDTCPNPDSIPDITTVQVAWDYVPGVGNVLQTITLTTANQFYFWDSLFINSDYTGNESDLESWNYYVLNGYGLGDNHINPGQTMPPGNGLYAVAANYTYTTAPDGDEAVRAGHANAINGINGGGLTLVQGGNNFATVNGQTLTYDFSSLTTPIILGDYFAIGWTSWCANDVVLVAGTTGGNSSAVPEPTTMALFGIGMAGLAGWRARRAKNKK